MSFQTPLRSLSTDLDELGVPVRKEVQFSYIQINKQGLLGSLRGILGASLKRYTLALTLIN